MNREKSKILMISCEGLGNGGVQAVIMNIVRNLKDEYSFDIVLFTNQKRYHEDEFESFGGKIFRIPKWSEKLSFFARLEYYLHGFSIYRGIYKILKENGPYSAIHCHNFFEAGMCLRAAKKAGVPVRISHSHIINQKWNAIKSFFDRIYLKSINCCATHKIGCSVEACDTFFGTNTGALVVNNPYNSERFEPKKFEQTYFDCPVITQIGSFSQNKNQLFSLEVVDNIKKEYPNARLNLIGFNTGDYLRQIQNKIDELNLKDNVVIYPSDADSPEILSKSSAFIFPSIHEGFGIVLIEAQAMGVACYVSDAVPKTTNCGGCTYLSLEGGAEVWAKEIIDDFQKNGGVHKLYDCSEYTSSTVAGVYKSIYGGKQY